VTAAEAGLRDEVARQLDELLNGPLASNGARATALLARNLRHSRPTPERDRLWTDIHQQYLARQSGVERDGHAALLTAGAPGAGKSTAVARLGLVDEGWRRLDADIVKDYLVQELAGAGDVDDVLAVQLADGRTVMPRELAGLVHAESVLILDRIRADCLRRGENVVIEGTLAWEPAGRQLLAQLSGRAYREVSIVDVEVPRELARAQAVARWWAGRCDPASELGGRWVPLSVIDRVYPDAHERHSVCAANARALFDSDVVRELPLARLTLVDTTGPVTVTETHERRSGVLQPRPGQQQFRWTPTRR
jgi:predicted kinase